MGDLTLYRDSDFGSFSVSNFFIDEYLSDANDAQIKVYLYLVRMMNGGRSTNISDMADKFNHTEKDITRALLYWEKTGIMSLNCDRNGNIVAIQFHDLTMHNVLDKASGMSAASTNTAVNTPVSLVVSQSASMTSFPVKEESAPEVSKKVYSKPAYTLDELKAFKEKEIAGELMFIAENYLKRPLSANDVRSLLFFTNELGFSKELIDTLMQVCCERKKTTFAYMDKVAIDWAENNIKTEADAKKYIRSNYSDTTGGQKICKIQTAKTNPNKGLETRDYDVDAIEKKLLGL